MSPAGPGGSVRKADGAAVGATGLRHAYRDREALSGIDLEVGAGEVFGLLGPNGGGKTTLFRILATLLVPSAGAARVFGIDVVARPHEARRKLGVMFQSPGLDVKLSGRENLIHQGHLYGLRGAALRRRADELLERAGLDGRQGDRVETLSGGLRRRVEIAKVLLASPALLLLDEPTVGLDPGARRDLWERLFELRRETGTTIFATTHLMEEADRCDRLAIIDRGRVVALGTPRDLAAEIGGDVVSIATHQPEILAAAIREKFGVAPALLDGKLRFERERGHEFLTDLIEAFPGQVDSVTVGKPTLEDVFFHRTGHPFVSAPENGNVQSPRGERQLQSARQEGRQ